MIYTSKKIQKITGFSLLEVLISASIIAVAVVSILHAFSFFIKTELTINKKIQGVYLLEEGIEAMRHIRDKNWTNISSLSTSTTYYLYLSTASTTADWVTTTTRQTFNGLERKITIGDVYRDATTFDIASSGTLDANTRKITVSIIWPDQLSTTTKIFSTYISKN